MQFYRWNTEKYRKATRHLSAFQHGCYRLLIDEYMETREPLPDNDLALANICRVSPQDFEHASSILRAFFKQKSGVLFHDYCDSELAYQDAKSKFMSERAKKAAEARYSKNNNLHATSMPKECLGMLDKRQEIREEGKPSSLPPTPHDEKLDNLKKSKSKKIDVEGIDLPEWLPRESWVDFCKHRSLAKKPLSERAAILSIEQLKKFHSAGQSPAEIINQSIMRGWSGLFELKNDFSSTPRPNLSPAKKTYSDVLRDAAQTAIQNLERKSTNEIY